MARQRGEPVDGMPGWLRYIVRVRGPQERVTKAQIHARVAKIAKRKKYPGSALGRAKAIAWQAIKDGDSPERAVALAVKHLRAVAGASK